MRRLVPTLILALACVTAAIAGGPEPDPDPPAAADLQGVYACSNPDRDYTGHVILVRHEKGYLVRWELLLPGKLVTPFGTVTRVAYDGYGEREGDRLTIAWRHQSGPLGLARYEIAADRKIAGNGETWRHLILEVHHARPDPDARADRGGGGSLPPRSPLPLPR